MDLLEAKNLVINAGIKLVDTGLIARTWGNVSCRVNDEYFVITPSGKSYQSLTPKDIVKVKINDLSYDSEVKPSSEKGIHAKVYMLKPEINFVIHTHQVNASVIGASNLNSMEIVKEYKSIKGNVICAKYALPGTKKLCNNVVDVIKNSDQNALIMKNHGALCYGENYEDAFAVAMDLEDACQKFIEHLYQQKSKVEDSNKIELARSMLQGVDIADKKIEKDGKNKYNSRRVQNGFELYNNDEVIKYENKKNSDLSNISEQVFVHKRIYDLNSNINHIIVNNSPEIIQLANSSKILKPLLDDYAQIVGLRSKNVDKDPNNIAKALKKSPMVLVRGIGMISTGKTLDDALAVDLVSQKACKAYIGALLVGKIEYINRIECMLMRFVYLKKYSKQKY